MDNKKIGKLIASLRNKQGLTQQELGDKVGVGFRAVSKWERGITLPDISIINELSKILGITSDELLSGKLNNENKTNNKTPSFIKILISVIVLVVTLTSIFVIYSKNKHYIYEMKCVNSDEYYIEGQVTFINDEISIIVNELGFYDDGLSSTIIENYDYKIISNNTVLFGYGYILDGENLEQEKTVKNITEKFRINYTDKTKLKRQDILENNIYLIINFIDTNNREIIKKIEISLLDET